MRYEFHPFYRPKTGNLAIPELSDGFASSLDAPADGFDPSPGTTAGGFLPFSCLTDEVPAGTYAIHLVLEAASSLSPLFLFTGRKQLRDIISLKKGERYKKTFYQSVTEIIPRYHQDAYPVRHLFFTCCARTEEPLEPPVHYVDCYAEPVNGIPVAYLLGDSTVTDQSCEIPYYPGACYSSWGQALPAFLSGRIAVENQAHCGLCLFYTSALKPG